MYRLVGLIRAFLCKSRRNSTQRQHDGVTKVVKKYRGEAYPLKVEVLRSGLDLLTSDWSDLWGAAYTSNNTSKTKKKRKGVAVHIQYRLVRYLYRSLDREANINALVFLSYLRIVAQSSMRSNWKSLLLCRYLSGLRAHVFPQYAMVRQNSTSHSFLTRSARLGGLLSEQVMVRAAGEALPFPTLVFQHHGQCTVSLVAAWSVPVNGLGNHTKLHRHFQIAPSLLNVVLFLSATEREVRVTAGVSDALIDRGLGPPGGKKAKLFPRNAPCCRLCRPWSHHRERTCPLDACAGH